MSNNLVIAFATTVVGLLIAMLAATLLSLKKAWYHSDAILIAFAANRLPQIVEAQSVDESPECGLTREEGEIDGKLVSLDARGEGAN